MSARFHRHDKSVMLARPSFQCAKSSLRPLAPLHHTYFAPLLAALAMFGPFCIDAIFPAFPAISAQFGAGTLAMQQTISVYLVAYAAMSLILGALSDAWGRRIVVLGGVAVFLLATAGCAMATTMPMLLAFRALQGCSAGIGLIVGRAIVRDCFEGAIAQKMMAQISMIFGVAPAIAPVIGAWLVALGSWRILFWAISAFALLLWILCALILPETHPRANRVPLSVRNLLSTYRSIVVDPQFLPLALTITFNVAALFIYVTCAPAFILGILGLGQNEFPWLFVPAISGLVLGSTLAARLAGRVNARVLLNVGYAIMLGAAVLGVGIAEFVVPARVPWAVLPIAIGAIGINMTAPTINLLVLDRFPRHRGAASSVQAFVTLAFNALLAGVLGPMLANSAMHLALAALVLYVLGFIFWRVYRTIARRSPPAGSIERELLRAPGSV
jgi:MFS transporter, DHA1 family, multidrug resistance protein